MLQQIYNQTEILKPCLEHRGSNPINARWVSGGVDEPIEFVQAERSSALVKQEL